MASNRIDPSDNPDNPTLWTYDTNNRIMASPGLTYTFDADGNISTRSDGASFGYDFINRLRTFTKGTTSAGYSYDPFGRRIMKTVNGTATWFLWDGDNLLAEYTSGGLPITRYAYAGGYAPIQLDQGGSLYDVHADRLETPRLLTNASQSKAWRATLQAYGQAAITDNLAGPHVTLNLRFPGPYADAESGLYYNEFRTYDPGAGRYAEADPIGQAGGINAYRYALNSPARFFDPFGLVEGSPSNLRKRQAIAQLALDQNGSTAFSFDANLSPRYPAESNKCSGFTCAAAASAGANTTVTVPDGQGGTKIRCPTAAELGPKGNVPDWRLLRANESRKPGDIMSDPFSGGTAGATGHAAIVVPDGSGGTTTEGAHSDRVGPPGADRPSNPSYRRYTGD